MTEHDIINTFRIATTVICQMALDGQISTGEALRRVEEARKVTLIECLRGLGVQIYGAPLPVAAARLWADEWR